ncbi:MAG: hypothetical protein JWM50_247 [Microbacteriaceae bacterium]|jgi:hypothetical protein|nr:hypothetical protein [Microbacteriaceae bacterium]
MSESTITVWSASDIPWADAQSVFATRGDPRGCSCQYFEPPAAVFDATGAAELAGARTRPGAATDTRPAGMSLEL